MCKAAFPAFGISLCRYRRLTLYVFALQCRYPFRHAFTAGYRESGFPFNMLLYPGSGQSRSVYAACGPVRADP